MELVASFFLYYIAEDSETSSVWVDFTVEEIYCLQRPDNENHGLQKVFMLL